ncbi:MAG: efflux RND transporter permease subunit [Opitutaceae bacterium]|nr:efflux RND transporter permease subunit [Opitutaceae bacterium]
MRLYELCVRRPVFTVVLSGVLFLTGAIALSRLGVREYPAVDPPVISVVANYPGANAEVIESQITVPLEEAVNTVSGIRSLTSVSRDGASRIRVEFELGTDLEAAANDVRDQISRAIRLLPRDVDPPSISKSDADSSPVLTLVVRSDRRDLMELTELADRVKDRLQTIPEVGGVDILGEKRQSIKLWLDPDRMAAHGLTALDVKEAVQRESVELPGGRVENRASELTLQAQGRLRTPEEFNRMAVLTKAEQRIPFEEIGQAEYAPLNERLSYTLRGVPLVGLAVRPQPGANQITIADETYRRLDAIRASLPADVTVEIATDTTQFVRQAVVELAETIGLALLLVVVVLFLFLGSWRVTLIPAVAIPISLVGTFLVMQAAGFSLNILTLLGLVLAVGLVVDDAIVVVENIHRRQEEGMSPLDAGIEGTKEVYVAVIATTLALVVVFSPIVFLEGLTGRLFREFGVVIASAVGLSAFVALTLTPMMGARIHGGRVGWLGGMERFLASLRKGYRSSLERVLGWRVLVLGVLAGCVAAVVWLHGRLPSELSPLEDRSRVAVRATGPEGASYDYMLSYMNDLAAAVDAAVPEAVLMTLQVPASGARSGTGVANTGVIELQLSSKASRGVSQAEIAARLTRLVRNHPGARVSISQETSIGDRRSGDSVQFVVGAPDMKDLIDGLPKFLNAVEDAPSFASSEVDLKFTRPELQVELDRERLQALGVSAVTVAQTLQSALSGQRVGYYTRNGRQYEVVQQLSADMRLDASTINRLAVRVAPGKLVSLDNLISVKERVAPPQRYRYGRQIAATVSARLAPGVTIADGIVAMRALARDHLPKELDTALTGAAADYAESQKGLLVGFALALVFVYLVMAAQFESWRAPFVIMLTVPLALVGALGTLALFDQTLNIFSQIGIIMLVGLITKNGILLVEFTLQRVRDGVAAREAVLQAADTRLRPILMTTVATVLGVVPIALALGAGSESRVSMGLAVIGGLIVGSVLTLYVVPSMYLLVCARRTQVAAPQPVDSPVLPSAVA